MTAGVLDKLSETDTPFGQYEEEAIVSLILDHPEFFTHIFRHMSYKLFQRPEVQYIVANIIKYYDKYEVFPTRGMLRDIIAKQLTADDNYVDDIMAIVDRKSDPREIPALKDTLLEWARMKAYGLIWDKETIERYQRGDYEYIEKVFEEAKVIQDIGDKGLWFFKELERLFVKEEKERFTTSIYELDKYLDEGGPTRKDMLVWMAPTGVGKSILLINNAISNVKKGKNVLYITLELSDIKSAIRALGALTNKPIMTDHKHELKDQMISMARSIKASGAGDFVIHEHPPDEIDVNYIHSLIDGYRRIAWVPDIVIIDYLELMTSRRDTDNRDEYSKQKAVATQVRGLAVKENVCIFTATQTNRSGNEDKVIDVTKVAESYGKTMPMDYLISINQTQEEYDAKPAQARLYIAKNRNGPKFISIPIKIDYKTMQVREVL